MAAVLALLLAALVAVEGTRILSGSRRTARLNRALHELRRPLQSISLSIEGSSPDLRCAGACMEQARGALEELDAAINRRPGRRRLVPTALAEIVAALEERWRFADVRVDAAAAGELDADPVRLGAALDNLVSNAVEHGSGPVRVRAFGTPGSVRFEVHDSGAAEPPRASGRDSSRGHGLGVAAGLAAEHGGSVIPPRRLPGGGTIAALSIPARASGAGPGPA